MLKQKYISYIFYSILTLNLILFGGPHLATITLSLLLATVLYMLLPGGRVPGEWFWEGLILISAIQLIPLPESILKIVAPGTYRILGTLHESAIEIDEIWHPISISPIHTLNFIAFIFVSYTLYRASFRVITTDREKIQRFFHYLAFASIFTIAADIINRSFNNGKIYGFTLERSHAFGQFINPNFAATVMGMSLLVYLHFAMSRQKREKQIVGLIISGFIYAGIFLTLSRSVIIYTSLLIIYSFINYSQEKTEKWILKERLILPILILIIVVYDIFAINMQPLINKFDVIHGALVTRKEIWSSVFNAFKESPLLGIGFGGLEEAFPFFTIHLKISIPNPDFDLLQFMAEGGAVSLLLVIYFIYWNIRFERARKDNLPSYYRRYVKGLDMALLLFLLHSIFAYVFFFPMTNYLFSTILGIRNGILHRKQVKIRDPEKSRFREVSR